MDFKVRFNGWRHDPRGGPPPRNPRECKANWILVLCSEWCFKDAAAAARSALEFHTIEMGGTLRCFKMPGQFLEWRSKMTKPYFLITDWRLAKPCIETTAHNQAMSAVVLCMDARQQRKALRWVSNFSTSGVPIHIGAIADLERTVLHLLATAMQHYLLQQTQPNAEMTLLKQGEQPDAEMTLLKQNKLQQEDNGVQVHHRSNQIEPMYVNLPQALQMYPIQMASGTDEDES